MAQAGADAANKVSVSFFFIYQALLRVIPSNSWIKLSLKQHFQSCTLLPSKKMLTVCGWEI